MMIYRKILVLSRVDLFWISRRDRSGFESGCLRAARGRRCSGRCDQTRP